MSERKAALVTGSTSGIGLGIATAFAKAGMDVTLNGLGDAAEIEKIRARRLSARPASRCAMTAPI